MNQTIPILMYHQVSPQPINNFAKYTITPQVFARQMSWLRLFGYHSISADDLLNHRLKGTALPKQPILLTFDDGFEDCVRYAVPILQAKKFTATFYIVVGLVGRASEWLIKERSLSLPMADWHMVRQLETDGFQIGAHSMDHPHLTRISPEVCRAQLADSRRLLADKLGHDIDHFAYPFGDYDAGVRAIAIETGYRTASSVRIGHSSANDDLHALHRIPVDGIENFFDFLARLYTSQNASEFVRSNAGKLRQRQKMTKVKGTL